MLLYDKRAGTIAVAYAIARSSEMPHFDKNAKCIRDWFTAMLQTGFENHRSLCLENLSSFSARFALLAFGKTGTQHADCAQLSDDVFEHMCYIFVIYQAYTEGFKVDKLLRERAQACALELRLPEQDMLWFFKKVIDDVWILHTHKVQAEEQFKLFG